MKDLLLPPTYGNRLTFPWLLVLFHRREGNPPIYTLQHGRNWAKFANRQDCRIIGHIKEKADAIACCRWYNDQLKPRERKHQSIRSLGGVDLEALKLKKQRQPQLFIPKGIDIKRTDK